MKNIYTSTVSFPARVVAAIAAILLAALVMPASAVVINLTDATINGNPPTAGGQGSATGSVGGTAVFSRTDIQTSGTGNFNPFLNLQNNGTEEGYNTDGALTMDTKLQNFTRNVQLSELQAVPVTGFAGTYYQFILDANQNANDTSGKAVLSIDSLVLFTSPTASISEPTFAALDARADTTVRFNLGANSIIVDSALSQGPGGGSADMFAFIPVSAFDGVGGSEFLYFYNHNGLPALNGPSNDGPEEWSARTGTASVPEGGATVALLGLALSGLGFVKGRFRKA